jgi:hypothetical protein
MKLWKMTLRVSKLMRIDDRKYMASKIVILILLEDWR